MVMTMIPFWLAARTASVTGRAPADGGFIPYPRRLAPHHAPRELPSGIIATGLWWCLHALKAAGP